MEPVTGPHFRDLSGSFSLGSMRWYRQRPPFNLVLPFELLRATGKLDTVIDHFDYNATFSSFSQLSIPEYDWQHTSWVVLRNQAYAKFIDKMSDSAGWAENLAQANKARKMVVDRVLQIWRFLEILKRPSFKGQFRRAARVLRTPTPSRVSHKKAVSQNFLEYEYGLKPLISDISSSLAYLDLDFGTRRISGISRSGTTEVVIPYTEGWDTSGKIVTIVNQTVKIYANVRVSNPNLFAAKQLGLIDIALPWKLIPFSFVVDWFGNVEKVLSSYTDFYGVTLEHPGTTFGLVASRSHQILEVRQPGPWQGGDPSRFMRNASTLNQQLIRIQRSTGIQAPTLIFPPFRGFSMLRGAQAAALIFAVLGK